MAVTEEARSNVAAEKKGALFLINMWKILNKKYPNNANVQFHETISRGMAAKVPSLPKNCKGKHITLYESSFVVLGPHL